jgi:hypothetical protein
VFVTAAARGDPLEPMSAADLTAEMDMACEEILSLGANISPAGEFVLVLKAIRDKTAERFLN